MPGKLKFHIVSCSSEDEHHPITEWYVHNPNSRGWQTPKGISIWPQEIGLQFEEVVNIQKIQFLSHQFKIASIIELFVGTAPDRNYYSYGQAEFKRLGYMSLDDNSKTDFKARELKSVHVRATGLYLKLLVHKPHFNHLNTYHQVGIIAVNIQGEPAPQKPPQTLTSSVGEYTLDPVTSQKIFSINLAKENAARVENYELAKQLKDIISYLRKVGQEIGKIEQKKKMAVEVEDYQTAAALKKEIDQMRSIAYSNIPDYPEVAPSRTPSPSELLSPRIAEQVVNPGFFQDYRNGPLPHAASVDSLMQGDVPKKMKDANPDFGLPRVSSIPTMSQYQSRAPTISPYSPTSHSLSLSAYEPRHAPSTASPYDQRPIAASFPPTNPSLSLQPPANANNNNINHNDYMRASVTEFPRSHTGDSGDSIQNQALPRQTSNKDVPKSVYVEDRPLPTAKYGFGGDTPRNSNFDAPLADDRPIKAKERPRKQPDKSSAVDDDGISSSNEPPPIPKDAQPLIAIFGEETVRELYDTAWAGRESALKSIGDSLPLKDVDHDTAFKNCCTVLARAFTDKIPQIYLAALVLLQNLLNVYGSEIRGALLRSQLSVLLPNIVAKTADNNTRLRDASFFALLSFAQHPSVGPHLIGSHVAKSTKNQAQWKIILGRISVLIEMIIEFGLSDSHSHPIDDEPSPGLDCDMACNFICGAFDSPNSDVRTAAVQAMAEVYKINPQRAQQATTGVKPKLLELIKIAFKDIDEQRVDQPPPVFYEQKPKEPAKQKGGNAQPPPESKPSKQPAKQSDTKTKGTKEQPKEKDTKPQQKQPKQDKKQPTNHTHDAQPPHHHHSATASSPLPPPTSSSSRHNHTDPGSVIGTGTDTESESFAVNTNDNRCQFCGLEDENFTEDLLDQHYMRDCPMLCECDCEQIIEISCLNEHQLSECDNAPHRASCPNCKIAVPDYDLDAHIAECPPTFTQSTWQQCPLCYSPTPLLTSKQWFIHLSQQCPDNPRNEVAAAMY